MNEKLKYAISETLCYVLIFCLFILFLPKLNKGYCLLVEPPLINEKDDEFVISLLVYFEPGCDYQTIENDKYNLIHYSSQYELLADRVFNDHIHYYNTSTAFFCINTNNYQLPLPENNC